LAVGLAIGPAMGLSTKEVELLGEPEVPPLFFYNNTYIISEQRSSYKKDLKRDLFYN
jgi:hypothetical protein